jgi:REP element-mobilizing transposase RayT
MLMRDFRKSPRLKHFDYIGPLAAHLVLVTRGRQSLFSDGKLARICIDALTESVRVFGATLHAYCVMPDHVHVLVEILPAKSLTELVRRFKQQVAIA